MSGCPTRNLVIQGINADICAYNLARAAVESQELRIEEKIKHLPNGWSAKINVFERYSTKFSVRHPVLSTSIKVGIGFLIAAFIFN